MENKTSEYMNQDKKGDGIKKKKRQKKSSALIAAAQARNPVEQVIANSAQDVRGKSDLPNTGPTINYENES